MKTVKVKKNPAAFSGRHGGFTLIEILVALTVIVIAILGFTLNTVGIIKGNHTSNNFTVATNLAQDKMEQLKERAVWANVNTCPDSGEQTPTATGASSGHYRRCWVIRDSSFGGALKQVDVTVSWRDSAIGSVTLSTLVFTQ